MTFNAAAMVLGVGGGGWAPVLHVCTFGLWTFAPSAKTGLLTDGLRDQVAAVARLVGAGACMATVAQAKTNRSSFARQREILDDKTGRQVSLH